jgi:beta-lactam-binding protein with PASTA domain
LTPKRFAVLFFKNSLLAASWLAFATLAAATVMRAVLISQEVPVPTLEGRTLPQAGALAGEVGLLVRVEGRRHHPTIPPEQVMAQDPPPGGTLKAERSVRVWLSTGPERLTVPPVTGQKVRSARLALEQALVPLARVVEIDDDADPGTVLEQVPPAGEAVSPEQGVSLLVSRGHQRPEYVMPDLIGRPAAGLADQLDAAGLMVAAVVHRAYPGVPPGIVVRQQPPAGYRVNPAVSVSFEVSQDQP